MRGESKDPESREERSELERNPWNLPRPLLPAGPAREVWPVNEPDEGTSAYPETPAAA